MGRGNAKVTRAVWSACHNILRGEGKKMKPARHGICHSASRRKTIELFPSETDSIVCAIHQRGVISWNMTIRYDGRF